MDRIDLIVDVSRIDPALLLGAPAGPDSARLRDQVLGARERAHSRGLGATASLSGSDLLAACDLDDKSRRELEYAARRQRLSGRGVTRLLRVARTAADLEGAARVSTDHIIEMLGFRAKEEP